MIWNVLWILGNEYEKLVNGQIDVGGIVAVTEERKKQVLFSDTILYSSIAIFTREDFQKIDLDEMTEFRIGVGKGYYTEDILKKELLINDYTAYDDMKDAIDDLEAGRIDVIFENQQRIDNQLMIAGDKGVIIAQVTNLFPREHAYAISRSRPELLEYMNFRIYQLMESGEFEDIYMNYFYTHSDRYIEERNTRTAFIVIALLLAIAAVILMMMRIIKDLSERLKRGIQSVFYRSL